VAAEELCLPNSLMTEPGAVLPRRISFVDKAFFEQVKSTPAKVHISFALTAFGPTEVRRVAATPDAFESRGLLQCRSPLKNPFLVVSTHSEETTCSPREHEKTIPPGTTFYSWTWSRDSAPAELGISPVKVFTLGFSHWSRTTEDFTARLCPGTPLTFTLLEEEQRTRSELSINGLRLADYQLMECSQHATAIGIAVH
jgi:hypothetical protein